MRQGFTLIELTVVLVIIGFLVGGVMTGRSLMKAAELRSITKELTQYKAIAADFKDRYGQLPGDFSGATAIWGAAHATPATCVTTASTTVLTCDGDGDGTIGMATGSNERFRFWQHLVNAQLMEGQFSGVTSGSTTFSAVGGTNVPLSKFPKGEWYAITHGIHAGDSATFALDYGNVFRLGAETANDVPNTAFLTPMQALNLDTKIDDGKPGAGNVVVYLWASPCTNAGSYTDYGASYNATSSAVACALFFRKAF